MTWILAFLLCTQPCSFSDNGIYPSLCEKLATDDARFQNFKRDPLYTLFAENLSQADGEKELEAILAKSPEFLERAKCNDLIGNPRTFVYPNTGRFSPTTLHYVNIAADLKQKFGSLDGLRIVEIGGSYGGLCTILSTLFSPKSYLLVDLPPLQALSRRYLEAQKISNVSFVSPGDLKEQECDLLVSYLSFSETDRSMQKLYLKKLGGAKAGYLVCSPAHWREIPYSSTEHKRVKPLPLDQLIAELQALGMDAKIALEEPATGKDQIVIFWKKR